MHLRSFNRSVYYGIDSIFIPRPIAQNIPVEGVDSAMNQETKTMEVPVAIADRVQALIDGHIAKEKFNAERREVVNNLLAMDGLSCEMAVYSLPQDELMNTLRFVYELSGTNSRFVKNILTQTRENPNKKLSDSQRSSAKSLLFNLLNDPSVVSAMKETS